VDAEGVISKALGGASPFRSAASRSGGIYIGASLVWLWVTERQRPNVPDLIGAAIAITGALVIIGFTRSR
jgi:drug/metabolite transporter superfamily protein YnfA